jgi:hypothetical protein
MRPPWPEARRIDAEKEPRENIVRTVERVKLGRKGRDSYR